VPERLTRAAPGTAAVRACATRPHPGADASAPAGLAPHGELPIPRDNSVARIVPRPRRGRPPDMTSEKSDSFPLATGTRYELLKEIGRGGMGVAHLALAKGPRGFSKLVVLKMMRKALVGDPEAQRMFLEEARISARLTHPNVVQVHEVCEFEGVPTMVMEYLEGKPLSVILRDDGLPAPRNLLIYILTKVLAGLHAAHDLRDYDGSPLNLVHRDASPHNVFVTFEGHVKLLDFGIAKAQGSEVETRAGLTKGKIRYMPPEQFLQLPADRRVDIFTVGVTLWEALTGRRFWANAPDDEVISRLMAKQIPALPPDADVPPDLAAICARAVAARWDERYATAARLQRDLEDYLSRQPDRVSADDVAVFMHYRFDVEQDSAKHVIQSHARTAQQAGADIDLDATRMLPGAMSPEKVASQESDPSVRGTSKTAPATAGSSTAASSTMSVGRPSRLRALAFASVAVLLLGAAAMAGVMVTASNATSRSPQPAGPDLTAACDPAFKACEGTCVSVDRPDRGCSGKTCYACNVPHATPRCNRLHACDIAVCYHGFEDCNGDGRDGCETDVRTDPDNCGACGRRCPALPHAERGCGDVCTIWRCAPGYRDCNGVVSDGCEVAALDDAAHCGTCGHACAPNQTCRNGLCR
jgi:serine/threonine protein kinase